MADSAILATFSDLKIIRTRKVAQIICEVPLEQANHALDILGGVPMPDRERWVGIAPVEITAGSAEKPAGALPPPGDAEEASPAAKPKQRWDDMPIAQRAGIMCADPQFWRLMGTNSERLATEALRRECFVSSRSMIAGDRLATAAFKKLETEYLAAIGRIAKP